MSVYCLDEYDSVVEFDNRYDLVRYVLDNVEDGCHVVVKCVPTFECIIIAHYLSRWVVVSDSDSQIIVELIDDAFKKLSI